MTRRNKTKDAKPRSDRVESRRHLDIEAAAVQLESLARSMREGLVVVTDESETVSVPATGPAEIRLRARAGKKKRSLEFRLELSSKAAPAGPEAPAGADDETQTMPDKVSF